MNIKLDILNDVRAKKPLVHNITNLVSANFSANGLLAIGASPVMADSPEETAEFAAMAAAVVINLGTPNAENLRAMLLAGQSANERGVPVVLDPVGVGATALRQEAASKLLKNVKFDVIRGNAAEIAHLSGKAWEGKGVDGGLEGDLGALAKQAAQKTNSVVLLSGKEDFLSDGERAIKLSNGSPLMPRVTASGCLLLTVCGAFVGVHNEDPFMATAAACAVYSVAGERAAVGLIETQSGSFLPKFLDELGSITPQQVQALLRIEEIS